MGVRVKLPAVLADQVLHNFQEWVAAKKLLGEIESKREAWLAAIAEAYGACHLDELSGVITLSDEEQSATTEDLCPVD